MKIKLSKLKLSLRKMISLSIFLPDLPFKYLHGGLYKVESVYEPSGPSDSSLYRFP